MEIELELKRSVTAIQKVVMDTTKIYHFDMEIELELKRSVNAIQNVVMETTKKHHLIWKLSLSSRGL